MGVNVVINLPHDVRVSDVAEAIGILAGLKPRKEALPGGSFYVDVKGVKVESVKDLPHCANIKLLTPKIGSSKMKPMIDGTFGHIVLYHFENSSSTKYSRSIIPRSTAFWCAVGRELVKFFGGSIQYQDWKDLRNSTLYFPKPRHRNNPEDGTAWTSFQEAMMNIKPLTKKHIERAEKVAAYKNALFD